MRNIKLETKERIDTIFAECARHRITRKALANRAGIKPSTLYTNMPAYNMSDKRLDKIERALTSLIKAKAKIVVEEVAK